MEQRFISTGSFSSITSAEHASKDKVQAEQRRRIERVIENSGLPVVLCEYMFMKDVAASGGLEVLSIYVKSLGYRMSTVEETKGAYVFAVTWRVKMLNCFGLFCIIVHCDPEPTHIK